MVDGDVALGLGAVFAHSWFVASAMIQTKKIMHMTYMKHLEHTNTYCRSSRTRMNLDPCLCK